MGSKISYHSFNHFTLQIILIDICRYTINIHVICFMSFTFTDKCTNMQKEQRENMSKVNVTVLVLFVLCLHSTSKTETVFQ